MADPKDTKSKLGSALTTTVQPGASKGSLSAALGGKALATGPAANHQVQRMDTATRNMLANTTKSAAADGHMGYIIDATASRADNWRDAQRIQRDMFYEAAKSGSLTVRLIHFGGERVKDAGWFTSAETLAATMGGVSCRNGHTQICESITCLIKEGGKLPRNIVLIGDSFEEDMSELARMGDQLRILGVKVFAFLDVMDGENPIARSAFSMLADRTGGSFQHFGRGMDLKGLCQAVAAYTTGGAEALQKLALTSKEAKAITSQVLRLSGPSGPKP